MDRETDRWIITLRAVCIQVPIQRKLSTQQLWECMQGSLYIVKREVYGTWHHITSHHTNACAERYHLVLMTSMRQMNTRGTPFKQAMSQCHMAAKLWVENTYKYRCYRKNKSLCINTLEHHWNRVTGFGTFLMMLASVNESIWENSVDKITKLVSTLLQIIKHNGNHEQ